MKVTITGTPGSGKSTLGRMLAEELGLKFFSAGDMRRQMARDHGMTLEEFNELGEKEAWTDERLDQYVKKYGRENEDFVVEGRMAWHFIPDSVKVFLDADEEVRAERMLGRKRPEESFEEAREAVESNRRRVESDRKRYEKYYGVDPYKEANFDVILDTTGKDEEEVLKEALEALKAHDNSK